MDKTILILTALAAALVPAQAALVATMPKVALWVGVAAVTFNAVVAVLARNAPGKAERERNGGS